MTRYNPACSACNDNLEAALRRCGTPKCPQCEIPLVKGEAEWVCALHGWFAICTRCGELLDRHPHTTDGVWAEHPEDCPSRDDLWRAINGALLASPVHLNREDAALATRWVVDVIAPFVTPSQTSTVVDDQPHASLSATSAPSAATDAGRAADAPGPYPSSAIPSDGA